MDYFVSFKSLFMFDEIDSGNAKSAGGGTVPPKNLVSLLKESKSLSILRNLLVLYRYVCFSTYLSDFFKV